MLNRTFTDTVILTQFDPAMMIILYTDTSGFTFNGIVKQYDWIVILRLVNNYSHKYSTVKQKWNKDTQKVFGTEVVVWRMEMWHYNNGANPLIVLQCDYRNLEHFQSS